MVVSGHRRGSKTCPRVLSFGTRPVFSAGRRPGLVLETRTCGVACLGGRRIGGRSNLLRERHAIMELGLFHDMSMILPGNLSGP